MKATPLTGVIKVKQDEYMSKDATITVRVPRELKARLARRAKLEHRSVSAQVLWELEHSVAQEEPAKPRKPALGLFAAAGLPSEEDFREVRSALWGRLGARGG